ncbi:MAG: hypothetical protein AMJ53_10810 [Gammaproteobacteria bacterium SG8_11]|nr:MAG: hypothetical protein AMJ53_10810 [Gammaproteobacteria bacterium SG8_11]
MINQQVETAKRICTGLAFFLYPLAAFIAFIAHPNLLSLEVGVPVMDKVAEFHNNRFMHFGHLLMVLSVPPLTIVIIKFMSMLKWRGAWWGFIGGVMALYGVLGLAVQKTAQCLVMSTFDTLPETVYTQLLPGIEAIFNLKGYLVIIYLLPLLPIGVLIQGIGLYREENIPRWQSVVMIIAMLGMGVSAAVDIDIFGLVSTLILAISWFPLGFQLIKGDLE